MSEGERFSVETGSRAGTDRVQLAAWRWGAGPARAVFLHAGVCDSRSWFEVVEHLGDAGPWVAYDRRGFGETPYTPGPYADLDDLLAVLDVVAGDGPVWLVGSSMGGGVALDAAISAPERVAGLVLIAPAVSGRDGELPEDPAVLELWNALQAASRAGDPAEVTRLETVIWLDGPAGGEGRVTGPARELAVAMNLPINQQQLTAADETAGPSGVDAWSRLGEIEVPVTVVWGDLDVDAVDVPPLVTRIAGARGIELTGRAHLPYREDPAQTAAIIATALGS